MDKQTFGIGVLVLTAVLLLVACLIPATPVDAAFAVKDRDYQLITTPNQQGGDTLFVVDNRTGMMAVFMYDVRTGTMRVRQVRAVGDSFVN